MGSRQLWLAAAVDLRVCWAMRMLHACKFLSGVPQVEQCGLTLAHQFPWAASSYVAVGLALRRRLLAPDTPSTAAKRKQISKVGCPAGHMLAVAHQPDVLVHCICLSWGCAMLELQARAPSRPEDAFDRSS